MGIISKLFFGIFSSVIESLAAGYILHKFGPEIRDEFLKLIGKFDPSLEKVVAPVVAQKVPAKKAPPQKAPAKK